MANVGLMVAINRTRKDRCENSTFATALCYAVLRCTYWCMHSVAKHIRKVHFTPTTHDQLCHSKQRVKYITPKRWALKKNSHSESLKVMHLAITEKRTRGSEEIATKHAENCRRRQPYSFDAAPVPPLRNSANISIFLIFPWNYTCPRKTVPLDNVR